MHHGQNGGRKTRELSQKIVNFVKIGGILKFCENKGNMHHWLRGINASVPFIPRSLNSKHHKIEMHKHLFPNIGTMRGNKDHFSKRRCVVIIPSTSSLLEGHLIALGPSKFTLHVSMTFILKHL